MSNNSKLKRPRTTTERENEINKDYFQGYNDTKVHRLMLGDQSRLEAYSNAIMSNKKMFQNKVVMDVGSGTGILALLAARAGASKVYAVEASDMALTIRLTARENGFGEVIQVIHNEVEKVELTEKVDIIVKNNRLYIGKSIMR